MVRSDARSLPADGLGVADRELDGAVEDRGQELLLLLLGAVLHERGPDGVERDERDGRVHPLRLFEEDELLERGKAASAILFGPADAEQIGGAECPHALLDGVAALHAAGDRGDAFGRHHRLERGADLGAQLFLLRCEIQMHRSAPRSESHGHAFDAGHHGGPHPVDVADQFELRISAEQHLEEDAGLESGQLSADARVLAAAEGDVRVGMARRS